MFSLCPRWRGPRQTRAMRSILDQVQENRTASSASRRDHSSGSPFRISPSDAYRKHCSSVLFFGLDGLGQPFTFPFRLLAAPHLNRASSCGWSPQRYRYGLSAQPRPVRTRDSAGLRSTSRFCLGLTFLIDSMSPHSRMSTAGAQAPTRNLLPLSAITH